MFAGRLLKTLSRDDDKKNINFGMTMQSSSKDGLNNNTVNSSIHSTENTAEKPASSNCLCSGSSTSVSYDETTIDLGSCSDSGSSTRPISIEKHTTDSPESSVKHHEALKKEYSELNGSDFNKVCPIFCLFFILALYKVKLSLL